MSSKKTTGAIPSSVYLLALSLFAMGVAYACFWAVAVASAVQSIPTVLIIKDGMVIDRLVGAVPKQHLAGFVSQHTA